MSSSASTTSSPLPAFVSLTLAAIAIVLSVIERLLGFAVAAPALRDLPSNDLTATPRSCASSKATMTSAQPSHELIVTVDLVFDLPIPSSAEVTSAGAPLRAVAETSPPSQPMPSSTPRPVARRTATTVCRSPLGLDDLNVLHIAPEPSRESPSDAYSTKLEPIVLGSRFSATETDITSHVLDSDWNCALRPGASLDDFLADPPQARNVFNAPFGQLVEFPLHRYYLCVNYWARRQAGWLEASRRDAEGAQEKEERKEQEAKERHRLYGNGHFVRRHGYKGLVHHALGNRSMESTGRDAMATSSGFVVGSQWVSFEESAWIPGKVGLGKWAMRHLAADDEDTETSTDDSTSAYTDDDLSSTSSSRISSALSSPPSSPDLQPIDKSISWDELEGDEGLPDLPEEWLAPLPLSPLIRPGNKARLLSWDAFDDEDGLPDLPEEWL